MSFPLPLHLPFSSPPHPPNSQKTHHLPSLISLPQTLESKQSPTLHLHENLEIPNPNPNPEPKRKPTIRTQLSKLCKDGRLDLARRLFDSLPRPTPALLWNTLLIGYVCNAMPEEALRLYTHMNASPNCPHSDPYTYSSALKACAETQQLKLGKSIHCHIIRRLLKPRNRVVNNSLLNMYASVLEPPCFDVVRLLFDSIPKRNVVAWNTLIAWYVRSRRPSEALRQFKLMMEVGIKPTPVSFINVFPAVAGVEGNDCSDVLYGLLIKFGNEYVNDLFVLSSAIFMYSELSDIRSARRVFDCATEKNIEVWNTMIGGYVQNDHFDEALSLFVQILESGMVPTDIVTFLASLMAVSQLQEIRIGQQIHAYLVKTNMMVLPIILSNALIVMYSRCGSVNVAFELFHQMLERDFVSWNTMISAFVQNDLNFEGLLLVYEMQKEGFDVDCVTVSALLSAASNLGNLRIGKETHGYLIRHNIQCEGMESYLVDMYSKSGSVDTAWRLFDRDQSGERDQVTWNAMIAGYTQNGQMEQAISVFRKMLDKNQIPNSVTLSSVLPASNLVGGILAGKQVHGFAIRRDLDRNIFVGTALVDMYSKCGRIIFAERVFEKMVEKNTVTYTTMLSGLGQHGLGERALSLFREMEESGMKPDAITFVAVISACSYCGLVDEGLTIFQSMEGQFGILPTPEHFCCVVDLLGRAGRVEEAYEFVQGLGDNGNFVGIWGSLLAACNIHGRLELGKLVSKRLFEIAEEGNEVVGYYVLLSNVYAAEGKWENVDRVRKEMREKGLRKEPGSSWIKVGDTSHRFMSKDQRHPENDRIYTTLEELVLEMKLIGKPDVPCLVDGVSELDQ